MVKLVTITQQDGTVYACQSPNPNVHLEWLAWYIDAVGSATVDISDVPEVSHDASIQ